MSTTCTRLFPIYVIEAGVMEYEIKGQDLVPLVRNAVAEIEVQASEKQIQINSVLPGEPVRVECDAARIIQVIVNLVGNAVKFSPRKGTIRVDVEAVEKIPEGVPGYWRMNLMQDRSHGLVTVTDFGPGIPDSEKTTVFERFHQVKQDAKMAGKGAGLGLAISQTIVEAHRGAVWVEDNPGGGSRFLLLLPAGEKWKNEESHASANHVVME